MNQLWTEYLDAIADYREAPTEASAAAVVDAYAAWCRGFCPSEADDLITEFRRVVADRSAHAA